MEEEETEMRNLDIEKEKACQAMADQEGRKEEGSRGTGVLPGIE
jgi:hypothetical protein